MLKLSFVLRRNMSQSVTKLINNADIAEKRLAELRKKVRLKKKYGF